MNLTKLFEMQKVLDERIVDEHGLEGQDLLPNKILALQVEIGELANEWKGFKHWKKDPQPNNDSTCGCCLGSKEVREEEYIVECSVCNGTGYVVSPMLEEYVDCLHFILSIGIELNYTPVNVGSFKPWDTVRMFISINKCLVMIEMDDEEVQTYNYRMMFDMFIGLGEMLGFTWEQIEQAYFDKNKVNHERQDNGY